METYLAADIGGTKTFLQAGILEGGQPRAKREQAYASAAYGSLEELVADFLKSDPVPPRAACFAVAGPVEGGQAKLTNLPWEVDAERIRRQLAIPRVSIINDFAAVALGVDALAPGDLVTLQEGRAREGTRIALGAGTGLGVAGIVAAQGHAIPLASEAGHMDFAPRGELEARLLAFLSQKYGRVSYERVVSGPGLVHIFDFLCQEEAGPKEEKLLEAIRQAGAAAITEYALERREPLAAKAVRLFADIYGAFAGNLALAFLALGGVYLAGGIAPKMVVALKEKTFVQAFRDKGRFAELMSEIPVKVIMNEKVGLLGAALSAARLTSIESVGRDR